MARYMIPVKVNTRKYVSLHFYNNESMAADTGRSFVCSIPRMGKFELFSIRADIRAASDECTSLDKPVKLCELEQPDNGKENYVLHFKLAEEGKKTSQEDVRCGNLVLSADKGGSSHSLIYLYGQTAVSVSLQLQLHLSDQTWLCMLTFDLIPQNDMYSLILDFGSEASQALCLPLKSGEFQSSLPFIDLAKKYISPQYAEVDNSTFHQYQNDGERRSNLFRSLFYIEDQHPLFLSLLSDDNKLKQKRRQLSNIKLALLNSEPDNVIRHYSNIVLNFIKCACYHILKTRLDSDNQEMIGLQLELLVPNVMSMSTTRKLIDTLQDKFLSLMDNPDLSVFRLEINAFSESDASFRGYFYNHRDKELLHANRSYLMIDAGKGTLDFSVISIQDREHFYSFYRDGFVGSGNAITYALFDHICAVIVGFMDNEGRKQLMQSLLFGTQTDQLGLRKLLNVLESIKSAEPNANTARRNCKALHDDLGKGWKSLNLERLVEYLENHPGDYGDMYGIIHVTCDKICKLLVQNLLNNHIVSNSMPKEARFEDRPACKFDEVILAGRAFRYPLLLETLHTHMLEYFGISKECIRFDSDMAKICCLYGLLHCHLVNSNCGLTGIPSIGKVLNNGKPQPKKQDKKNVAEKYDFLLKAIYGEDNEGSVQDEPVKGFHIDSKFLNEGYDIKVASNEVLRMNGHEMQNENNLDGELFNMYYDGTDLLLRNENNVSPLRRSVAQIPIQSSLIFESRFPDYEPTDKSSIRYYNFPELVKTDYHEE